MLTNPIVASIVRATSTFSRSGSSSSSHTNTTPLQRVIIQSRRHQQCTSVRYILVVLSAIYLMGCISYCCYIIIATYHVYPYPFTQNASQSSMTTSTTIRTNRDMKNRRVHVLYWDTDEHDDNTELENMQHSKIGATNTQLSTASFAGKVYYPWNMFGNNMKDQSYIRKNEESNQDATKRKPPQHVEESSSDRSDEYDDDASSSNSNDDNYDDDTTQKPSLSQHVVKRKKKYNEQLATTTSAANSNSKNPAIYGWTPNQYPNPIVDPVHCAVSYILPHLQQQQPEQPSPANVNSETLLTTPPSSPTYVTTNFTLNKKNDVVLRLCDPDWVLGGIYLEDVARALYNFSTLFGTPISENRDQNPMDEQNNDVSVSNVPSSGLVGSQTATNNNDPQPPKEDDWNVEVGPSNRQRRSLRSDVYLSSSSTLFHESNSLVSQRRTQSSTTTNEVPRIELAVATVRKMNIPLVLRQGNANNNNNYNGNNYYSTYENDDDDLVNDAAQIFARTLHDDWWSSMSTSTANGTEEGDWYRNGIENRDDLSGENPADYGILLFLSVQDRVCFISTGSSISVTILPWWRLDHIVTNMKPYLQNRNYGTAILHAIHDISNMLQNGPPTLSDRIHDFVSRFGVVIAFAAFTFCFGAWGEYRDRRKRWQYAEQRSMLTSVERQKAQQMQMEFRTRCCPICLESFDYGDSLPSSEINDEEEYTIPTVMGKSIPSTNSLLSLLGDPRKGVVDEYGIPRRGADGRKIKLLRCGHVFCETCWRSWVHSTACGSPCSCPVCRQDVGKTLSRNRRSQSVPAIATTTSPDPSQSDQVTNRNSNDGTEATVTRTMSRNTQSYDSFADQNRASTTSTTRIVRVNTMLRGAILFRQTSAVVNRSSEYIVEDSTNGYNGHTQTRQQQRSDENSPLLSI